MGILFKPDIFSVSSPLFRAVSVDVDRCVRELIRQHYQGCLASITAVEQFGGNEINSNNFKVSTGDREYLLKRLPGTLDAQMLERQLALMIWLREVKHIVVPDVIPSQSEKKFVHDREFYWCLFEFVSGDFFGGTEAQMLSTAVEIGRLQSALSGLPDSLLPPRKWEYCTASDREMFRLSDSRRPQWRELFGHELNKLLVENWGSVAGVAAELSSHADRIRAMSVTACHCDLHPHNILVADGKLRAFIDFESFTLMPVQASLGFATYKLMKQYAVSAGLSERDAGSLSDASRRFVAGILAGAGWAEIDIEGLRLMAFAEVFRRLLIVLRLNIESRNRDWNHVLPMHLAGLAEIKLLFGSQSN